MKTLAFIILGYLLSLCVGCTTTTGGSAEKRSEVMTRTGGDSVTETMTEKFDGAAVIERTTSKTVTHEPTVQTKTDFASTVQPSQSTTGDSKLNLGGGDAGELAWLKSVSVQKTAANWILVALCLGAAYGAYKLLKIPTNVIAALVCVAVAVLAAIAPAELALLAFAVVAVAIILLIIPHLGEIKEQLKSTMSGVNRFMEQAPPDHAEDLKNALAREQSKPVFAEASKNAGL